MNRKPIFDAVRVLLGRKFTQAEVDALDHACDLAEAAVSAPIAVSGTKPIKPDAPAPSVTPHRLGSLSEDYESGGRGPGTVSSGAGDPGGVSYGVYQLASKAGTLTAFMKAEGKRWAAEFGTATGGSAAFTTVWKAIAAREAGPFRDAQHAFIERTHYLPAVQAVLGRKGIDLNTRHDAVRDATWSVSVQHGGAASILISAIDATDPTTARDAPGYDKKLVEAIYKARTDYVLKVASNPKLPQAQRDQLISITKNRYPKELAGALAMFAAPAAPPTPAAPVVVKSDGTIDGNIVAANNGVDVKSASVKISKLHPKMEAVIVAVAKSVKKLSLPKAVITSGNDSKHSNGSLHYIWRALDFRGNNIQPSVGKILAGDVASQLGKDYDVIFETFINTSNNHLHVEYDPK